MLAAVLTIALAAVVLEVFASSSTPPELRLPPWRRTPTMHLVAILDGALLFCRLSDRQTTRPRL